MNISTSPIETNDTRPTPAKATKPVTSNVTIDLNLIAQLRKDIAKIGTDSAEGITKRQAIILLLPAQTTKPALMARAGSETMVAGVGFEPTTFRL